LIAAGGRGLGVVTLVVPLYLKLRLHLDDTSVTGLYSLLLLGSVVGPLLGGVVGDRVGRRAVLVSVYLLSAVITMVLVATPAQPLLLAVVLALMGMVVYEESPLLQTFVADEAPAIDRDAIFSLYFAVSFGIGALWAVVVGAVLQGSGFSPVFLIMVASYLVAGVCIAAARPTGRVRR